MFCFVLKKIAYAQENWEDPNLSLLEEIHALHKQEVESKAKLWTACRSFWRCV